MANMAYCRFRNTLSDFNDCLEAVEFAGNLETELSPEELEAAKHLYKAAERYVGLFPNIVYENEG